MFMNFLIAKFIIAIVYYHFYCLLLISAKNIFFQGIHKIKLEIIL